MPATSNQPVSLVFRRRLLMWEVNEQGSESGRHFRACSEAEWMHKSCWSVHTRWLQEGIFFWATSERGAGSAASAISPSFCPIVCVLHIINIFGLYAQYILFYLTSQFRDELEASCRSVSQRRELPPVRPPVMTGAGSSSRMSSGGASPPVGRLDTVKSNQTHVDADLEMIKTVPVSRE